MQPSQLDQILHQQVAASSQIVDVDEPLLKLVVFRLHQQYFAVPGAQVKEILPGLEQVFFLPGMPAEVEGVVNLRGAIESVLNFKQLLQLDSHTANPNLAATSLLLAQGQDLRTCLRVDELLDLIDLPTSQLQEPPSTLPKHLQPLVTQVFNWQQLAVACLDLDAIFAVWQQG